MKILDKVDQDLALRTPRGSAGSWGLTVRRHVNKEKGERGSPTCVWRAGWYEAMVELTWTLRGTCVGM